MREIKKDREKENSREKKKKKRQRKYSKEYLLRKQINFPLNIFFSYDKSSGSFGLYSAAFFCFAIAFWNFRLTEYC